MYINIKLYIHLGYNMLILHSWLVNDQLIMSLTIILDLLNEPNKKNMYFLNRFPSRSGFAGNHNDSTLNYHILSLILNPLLTTINHYQRSSTILLTN